MNKKRLVMAGLILLAFFLISNLAQARKNFLVIRFSII